ncbi:MAG: hypothetical protein KGR22_08920 [Planctomycetes bacterium]|nr:hypothetical protein [Planctomycetota bacterium]
MHEPSKDRAHPWAVAAVLALMAMAVTFGLVVPSARPSVAEDGFVPVGEVIVTLERLRADIVARASLRPESVGVESQGMMATRLQRAFGRPIAMPDLTPAGLVLMSIRVETDAAPQQTAILGYGDGLEVQAWIGLAEDVGQFAICDRFGQLVQFEPDQLVGDLGSTDEPSVYAWRNDGLLWIVMGDDAALLTQVLAGADAPERSAAQSR